MANATFKNVTSEKIHGHTVYTVEDPHSLTQVSGYIRYESRPGRVFFRGQVEMYAHLFPSLFRGCSRDGGEEYASQGAISRRTSWLNKYIAELSGGECSCDWFSGRNWYARSHDCSERLDVKGSGGSLVSGTYRAAIEPLLQHYGVHTRWVDAVDNIWVALWFACHRQITKDGYAYHLRRSQEAEMERLQGIPYAYVYMLKTDPLQATEVPGYDISQETRLVDLRYCVPSVYLRPHAQHGVLLARRRLSNESDPALQSLDHAIGGVIRVRLGDALNWLGDGSLTNHFTLFPPAVHDVGYHRLMSGAQPKGEIGRIVVYQGGM